jgi:hypothetical protein
MGFNIRFVSTATYFKRKHLHLSLCLLFLVMLSFLFCFRITAEAAGKRALTSPSVTVSATVGEYYLNVSGYIAPYASIVLTSNGIFYRSTVADKYGNFSLSGIQIRTGFSGFCILAKDFHNIGESYTCFSFPPATGDITMKDLFLPPTLALERNEIQSGGTAKAYGYTMPLALVRLHVSGKIITTYADAEGYYEVIIANVPAGSYSLFADATYNGKNSEQPSRTLTLKSLPWWAMFIKWMKELLDQVWKFLIGIPFGALWLALPFIILIPLLIIRIWPERFTWIYSNRLLYFISGKPRRLLHHA